MVDLLRVVVLLNWTRHAVLVVLLLVVMLLMLLSILLLLNLLVVARHALEVRRRKSTRAAGLERAPEEQLRGEERSELHVEGGTGSGHIIAIGCRLLLLMLLLLMLLLLAHGLGVDRGDVSTSLGVSVTKAADSIGGEGTVGEASVTVGRLGNMTISATGAIGPVLMIQILHPE